MAMFAERIDRETPELRRGGRADALHRPPRRASPPSCVEQMDWAEARPRPTTGSRCSSPSTTAGGRRSSTRRERFTGRRARRSSARLLYAPDMHDPDLIIRTSGEQRLSNYLLWQSAYSELVLPRRAVAGLRRARRSRRRSTSTRARQRRFGGAVMPPAAPPTPRAAGGAARRPRTRRARARVAIPAIAFAIVIVG